mmetsp:Transcript_1637/g.2987  ORF Transcript_1637/g.2987 Transcript_1637/m.2987 type:complete len:82 (-) Transcript_1637:49-294(-)
MMLGVLMSPSFGNSEVAPAVGACSLSHVVGCMSSFISPTLGLFRLVVIVMVVDCATRRDDNVIVVAIITASVIIYECLMVH